MISRKGGRKEVSSAADDSAWGYHLLDYMRGLDKPEGSNSMNGRDQMAAQARVEIEV
jgi:hypothetical protein